MMNIKDDVSHIINKELSTHKDILCYPSEEPNSISIPKDFIEPFKECIEKSPENCIYHIRLIEELLKYYKKEDINIYKYNYRRKFIPEKDSNALKKIFKGNDIYDFCEPVSLIDSEIYIPSKNKNFSLGIRYLFDEKTTPLPRIQFYVLWRFMRLHYYYDYSLNFQGHTHIQEYTGDSHLYSELLNPNKISEIIASFVEINRLLESYFKNVFIENAKLKKMSNIIWTTLTTLITKKIGGKIGSFSGNFENRTLLLYFIRGNKRFKIDVENYDSRNFDTIIKDIGNS